MRGTDRQAAAPLSAFEGLANALYCAVVQPDTIWWDDLTPEMQAAWLRAAKVAARSDSLDVERLARALRVLGDIDYPVDWANWLGGEGTAVAAMAGIMAAEAIAAEYARLRKNPR